MKKIRVFLTVMVILAVMFAGAVTPAKATSVTTGLIDLCDWTVRAYVPEGFPTFLYPEYTFSPGPDGWIIMSGSLSLVPWPLPAVAAAPVYHEDGRLNFRVCRAPLAVFMDESGGVEVWSTDESGQFAALDLKVSATAEEIAAALALAEETGEDVVIAGYADGFALIAKADGTLKAEVIGQYGCDFMANGEANDGWCLGYGPFDPGESPGGEP